MAIGASVWFQAQSIRGRNAIYATAVLMGCGGSVMLITSLSMIADMIGGDKVRESALVTCPLMRGTHCGFRVSVAEIGSLRVRSHRFLR